MVSALQKWPEPIVRVQSLSESGINSIPEQYIKLPSERPSLTSQLHNDDHPTTMINIPVIDLSNLYSDVFALRDATYREISDACRDGGFFQIVNHGVCHELMKKNVETWREFFHSPVEEKVKFANSPDTYEGYGSRLGVEKDVKLDWCDYFFLYYAPENVKDINKWPNLSNPCREIIGKYGKEVVKLCQKLLKVLSVNLGLEENRLQNAFGGDTAEAGMRVNYYPKCPQPDLTLGVSPHSDPGGITVLLPSETIPGLQVRKGDSWITVNHIPNSFIINMGDQIEVLTNATYKSVEHRVLVNQSRERMSFAFFYNPRGDIPIEPIKELLSEENPALYPAMTYHEYRKYIRIKGTRGKAQVESLKSPR